MNRPATFFVAAAITVLSHAAMAQDAIPATWANEVATPVTSTVSRAEVRAALEVARQTGQLNPFDSDVHVRVNAPVQAPTMLARTQQGAERVAALARQPAGSGLTREQVRAEFLAARQAGQINSFDNLADWNAPVKAIRTAPATLAQAAR